MLRWTIHYMCFGIAMEWRVNDGVVTVIVQGIVEGNSEKEKGEGVGVRGRIWEVFGVGSGDGEDTTGRIFENMGPL